VFVYPDPYEALAESHDVAAELGLDPALVTALQAHLNDLDGRPPTVDQLRTYVRRLVTSVGEPTLRERLHLPPAPASTTPPTPPEDPPAPIAMDTRPVRRRGRPRGTRTASRQELLDAYRALRVASGRPPTQAQLAENLDPPVTPRTLQAWLAEYGLPWPPE
jgi:hypothetical protein